VILSHACLPIPALPLVEGLYLPLYHGVKRLSVRSLFELVGGAKIENEHVIRRL